MAITNVQAVAFCNSRVRVIADKLAQTYYACLELKNDWNAQGVADVLTNTSDVVDDGSDRDGRAPVTGAAAVNVVNRAIELVADLDAEGKIGTILAVAVNPMR
mgnify:CR=1 FL=1